MSNIVLETCGFSSTCIVAKIAGGERSPVGQFPWTENKIFSQCNLQLFMKNY